MHAKRIYFGDYVFVVDENVYEPAEDSFLFAENLNMQEAETVLDMGTGCGILGILVAKIAGIVVAVDVNPYAIRIARENAKLNNMQNKIYYVQGDLFTPFNESARFDVILFNAPYLPSGNEEAVSWIEHAWAGGAKGRKIINRFIAEAPNHLKQRGRVLLMQSTLANLDETLHKFIEYGMSTRIAAERNLPFFEKITLIEAKI